MIITEREDVWRAEFFPEAKDKELDDKLAERGWRSMLGEYNDNFVPKYVEYDKHRFNLPKAIELAKNISECNICTRLKNNVADVEKLNLINPDDHITNKQEQKPKPKPKGKEEEKMETKTSSMFKDLITETFFKTAFTRPGLFLIASMLDDDSLLSTAIPENMGDAELQDLAAEIGMLFSGDLSLLRSPDSIRSYIQAMKEGSRKQKPKKDKDKDKDKEHKNKEQDIFAVYLDKLGARTIESLL